MILDEGSAQQILIQRKGKSSKEAISISTFEELFGLQYTPSLCFFSLDQLKELFYQCPWVLRLSPVAFRNRMMGKKYRSYLSENKVAKVSIRWINDAIGYGLFAEEDLPKGSWIGEYVGKIRKVDFLKTPLNSYCFHYPTKWGSRDYYVIDAMKVGNELRFVNHSDHPNLVPECLVDRRILHQVLFSKRDIAKGEELTFNYGSDFWRYRHKLSE